MIRLRDIILEQSTNPKALILAGAPGAGKSSFIEDVDNALILNVDDYFIRNLKDAGVSLDLKNADAEARSKAAKAMAAANKEFRPITRDIILGKKNFILDGTAASSRPTLALKKELLISVESKTNFFEKRVSEYSMATKIEKQEDAFEFGDEF